MNKLLEDYNMSVEKLEKLKKEKYYTEQYRDLVEKQIEYLEKYIDVLTKRIYGQ